MASSTTNVLRHTALVTGLLYGLFHARTVQTSYTARQTAAHEQHEGQLLHQAKEAWTKTKDKVVDNAPISDPEDPKFDLEALVNWATGEKASA